MFGYTVEGTNNLLSLSVGDTIVSAKVVSQKLVE